MTNDPFHRPEDFRRRLASGVPQLGICSMYASPGIIERIGPDWDWLWLDGQHGELDQGNARQMVRACDLIGRASFLRVPGQEYSTIGKGLDAAPTGLIVPCVNTPEQAAAVVQAGKFAPTGNRSYGGRRPIDLYGRNYSEPERQPLLILQIESPEALENVETIAAMPGVDGLFLGPDDLLIRQGCPMDTPRNVALLGEAMERVVTACHQNDKPAILVGMGDGILDLAIAIKTDMIVVGGDVPFLAGASKQAAAAAREAVAKGSGNASGGSLY